MVILLVTGGSDADKMVVNLQKNANLLANPVNDFL